MSREIKFRAWDKERQEMRQIQLLDWSAWWVSTGSTWERGNSLEYGERNSFKNEETDRHILMQYTGLKDKNGIEIYEGDILKTHKGEFVVTWDKYMFILPGYYFGSNDVPYDYFSERSEDEVIGNIYDNPELLEAKHD